MSIYLQGVCLSFPFYLSKHIWCPVAGASNRNVCFPEDACSLCMQFCALRYATSDKLGCLNSLNILLVTHVKGCYSMILTLRNIDIKQFLVPINNSYNPSNQYQSPSLSFRQQEPLLSQGFIHLKMLLPRHLM